MFYIKNALEDKVCPSVQIKFWILEVVCFAFCILPIPCVFLCAAFCAGFISKGFIQPWIPSYFQKCLNCEALKIEMKAFLLARASSVFPGRSDGDHTCNPTETESGCWHLDWFWCPGSCCSCWGWLSQFGGILSLFGSGIQQMLAWRDSLAWAQAWSPSPGQDCWLTAGPAARGAGVWAGENWYI